MKGVFLCAGKGTRMRPVSYSVPKHLIPVANKRILQYNVEKVIDAGIDQIGLVVSPEMEGMYRDILGTSKWGASITYIHQEDPRGLAHAVDCARDYVQNDPFLVYLGDNLLQTGLEEMVTNFRESNSAASILLASVDDPERFGVAEIEDGKVVDLIEKPDQPPSDLAIVGTYLFTEEIFSAIDKIEPSDRGELEITDAIARLIRKGSKVTPSELEGWWLDVGRPSDAIDANKVLLRERELSIEGESVNSDLRNRSEVGLEKGSRIQDSHLNGPVHVARGSEVINSELGPNVSVGEDVVLEDTRVSNAIIMSGTRVSNSNLTETLIGTDSSIELPGYQVKATLGSQAEVEKKE